VSVTVGTTHSVYTRTTAPAQTEYSLQAPGLGYWVLVGGGMVASLAIIASTLSLLGRTTGPDAVRNE
jgi:hypothetical protein